MTPKITTALFISKYIIKFCDNNNIRINNLNLQKILYILQVEFLKRFDKPMFVDSIEAWGFGPCVPNSYYHYCGHGVMPIWTTEYDKLPGLSKLYDTNTIDLINTICITNASNKPWEFDTQLFGKDSLWHKIYTNYVENIKQEKEKDPCYQSDSLYNPPIPLTFIKDNILGNTYTETNTDLTLEVSYTVLTTISQLAKQSFNYDKMGYNPNQRLHHWELNVDSSHDITIDVYTQNVNEPLKIYIMLNYLGKAVHVLTPDSLKGQYILHHDNLLTTLTIK